jgi:uncharacterized protein (DUF1697 family)
MKTYISILRGINVGGHKKVPMAELKALYQDLKFTDIITYIQSGNVVFKSNVKLTTSEISKKIEKKILEKFNFEVPVLVREADEMEKIVKSNPFLKDKSIDTDKLHITFLTEVPSKLNLDWLNNYNFPPDKFIIEGKEVFLHIPDSYGNTKLSNTFFENKLKVGATTRNWKTVNKLVELGSI